MKNKSTKKVKVENCDDYFSDSNYRKEILHLGHFIKYNLYLLCKSVIFSSLCSKFDTIEEVTKVTNKVIEDLDLNLKSKS